jgi:hypothetical protein
MNRAVVRIAIAVGLIGLGWAAGTAQTTQPVFELIVEAPAGETTVTCVRGCGLTWVERGVHPAATPMLTFKYNCNGQERCSSYKIGGWIKR